LQTFWALNKRIC